MFRIPVSPIGVLHFGRQETEEHPKEACESCGQVAQIQQGRRRNCKEGIRAPGQRPICGREGRREADGQIGTNEIAQNEA
jgi:hypothetical protein